MPNSEWSKRLLLAAFIVLILDALFGVAWPEGDALKLPGYQH